ncbi:hypothetical protein PTW37_01095 [Arthrobacter agilis]|uniref:hypothetical protein n=1 Tax=Arthrobacter agilis TaxID=37921 RepID=UPI002365887F|nr:hypothetical protein [Arthrobacter agilis]WDF33561.1 hypothetical protein PTW37_01095 [Arthrobacter agilis]
MGISSMVKNAASRYLGRSGRGTTTGRTGGTSGGRRGTPMPSGKAGGMIRNLLNRR